MKLEAFSTRISGKARRALDRQRGRLPIQAATEEALLVYGAIPRQVMAKLRAQAEGGASLPKLVADALAEGVG